MTEFEVFVSANYRAEENQTVKIEAKNKDEAEEIALGLAKADKFLGAHEYLASTTQMGFQIFENIGDVTYSAEAEAIPLVGKQTQQ